MNRRIGAIALSMGLLGVACDEKKEGPPPEVSKEAPAAPAAKKGAPQAQRAGTASRAVQHLPPGCLATTAVDLKSVAADKLIKEHLLGPLDKNLARLLESPRDDEKEMKQALDLLGIDSVTKVHSLAVCAGAVDLKKGEATSFGLVVAGQLNASGKLIDVAAKAQEDGRPVFTAVMVGDTRALKEAKEGTLFAQAKDGALLIASDEKMLASMLKPSEAYKAYGLPLDRQLAMVVNEKLAQEAIKQGGQGSPLGAMKPGVFSLSGSVDGKFAGKIEMDSEKEAKESAAALNMLMVQFGAAPDPQLQALIKAVKVTAEKSSLALLVDIPAPMIESGIKEMARQLEAEVGDTAAASEPAP
jgi:hypothetical protein